MVKLKSVMKSEKEILCAIALNRIPGIGSVTYRRLIERFGSAEGAFRAGRAGLETVKGIRKEAIEGISSIDPEKSGAEELAKVKRAGFRLIFIGDPEYPANLAQIYDPPPVLYVTGTLEDRDRVSVAVVGSRDPTDYGRSLATRIVGELAHAGVVIISGMARGIDSIAHRAALDAGGRTIAVLGSGLDVIYPREHDKLYNNIRNNGAVISPYAMGTKPEKGNFPARNRVISGLSLGVIVVQATTPDSGSLITARHALEQNREVFAVPGHAGSQTGRGTNRLIKKGEAKLIESASDVLEEILPQVRLPAMPGAKEAPAPPLPNMTEKELMVYERTGEEPLHIDIIARKCNIPVHELSSVLLELELKGLVEQRPGMNYVRKAWPGNT